jgi:hypothetical protein
MEHCRPGETVQTGGFAGQADTQFSLTGWGSVGILSGMIFQPVTIVALVRDEIESSN